MSILTNDELSNKYFFYHKDGLLDIFIGLGILMAGATLWAGMPWMAGAWLAIFVPLWISIRKSVTYPRVAEDEVQTGSKPQIVFVLSVLAGLLVLGVFTGIAFLLGFERFSAFRAFLDTYIHLLMGLGLAVFLTGTAAIMRVPRFFVYALLTLMVFGIGQVTGWLFWMSMSLVGGLISLAGLAVLGRFLRAHPVAE